MYVIYVISFYSVINSSRQIWRVGRCYFQPRSQADQTFTTVTHVRDEREEEEKVKSGKHIWHKYDQKVTKWSNVVIQNNS